MDVQAAVRRWAETWARAWRERDVDAITSLYADDALYRGFVFRQPDRGTAGIRRYLEENFGVEEELECWFGEPIAAGSRAAVEWWATWVENGQRLTLAGTTILRFDQNGQVVDHRDYWSQVERRQPPFQDW
jgi:SnoaL-like protein